MRKQFYLFALLIVLLLIVACGGEDSPTPTPIPPPPTAVSTQPSNTPPATPAETATIPVTLLPPPTLAPVATSTVASEPLAEGVSLLTAADFGTDRNPLTGELMADPMLLQRRPLAIKISNAPPSFVRPQAGLNSADWVFEHTAEGNITRFTLIVYGQEVAQVGPIRSARLIDVELPAMYDAALAFSGASVGVNQRLNASDFESRIIRSADPGYFRTGEDKPFEHTLYGRPAIFRQGLEAFGLNTPPSFNGLLTFTNQPPAGGTPASSVALNYEWEIVEWRYDSATGRYLRWAAGEPHLDGNTGEQVSASNIVIIAPNHVEDATICEQITNDVCTHLSVQIQLWGSGTGIILRDGQQYPITWHREERNDLLTFTAPGGTPFPLQIGNTWVQFIPTWYDDPVSVTP
ncbi:DUF3048 domain-containing protein [Candidatus Leptofilum sp.]|uniref:DUF3048 domain-containing protein n=1 Tax=Candidatus Leptofilum sp. TaxID=3241576 RepID=UPI003B5B452D